MNSKSIKLTSTILDQMVEIPKGRIELRDDRTKEKWLVEIEPFMLYKFPVTQAIYFEITNENPSAFIVDLLPVETVTFKDAVIFCNELSVQNDLSPCYLIQGENEEITF